MKNRKNRKWFIVLGLCLLALMVVGLFAVSERGIRSEVVYQASDPVQEATEVISDEQVPLAASQTNEVVLLAAPVNVPVQQELVLVYQNQGEANDNAAPTPTPTAEQTENTPAPSEEPEAPVQLPPDPTGEPEAPAAEEPTPTPDEPTPAPSPAKAQKPADIKDTVAMAKYLFDAATEFWAVEKNFSGTTTRPVSTRVAASIGAGTAVDCPGGDTVRIDKDGVVRESYAIADHFRAYVDMPDLQYFKIYLSEKDYSVHVYGAREEVIGAYYQYGSERTTYMAQDEENED
jgi:outer membrane biosynthesis protein TonB